MRDAVLAIKHAPAEPLAVGLIELLWSVRCRELAQLGATVVVPMPMHWIRRLERGANAPEILADRLARRLAVPMRPLLARRRHTVPQSSLAPQARLTNLRNAFGLRSGRDCRGARVLLVDDVLTTGATCCEASKVLLRGGAASVAVAVLARAEGPV
jgi:ComF family protein